MVVREEGDGRSVAFVYRLRQGDAILGIPWNVVAGVSGGQGWGRVAFTHGRRNTASGGQLRSRLKRDLRVDRVLRAMTTERIHLCHL